MNFQRAYLLNNNIYRSAAQKNRIAIIVYSNNNDGLFNKYFVVITLKTKIIQILLLK